MDYPKEWKLDCKELGGGKTFKEKEDIRNKKILEESLKVAACMDFFNPQCEWTYNLLRLVCVGGNCVRTWEQL